MKHYYRGRPRLKLYQYDAEFKYLRSYETQSEVFDKYYDGKKGELFRGKEYKELPDGTYIAAYRIGRTGLAYWTRVYNCVYCSKNITDKPFSAYNHEGNKVASFANSRVFTAMTGIPSTTVVNALTTLKGKTAHNGLVYKYD